MGLGLEFFVLFDNFGWGIEGEFKFNGGIRNITGASSCSSIQCCPLPHISKKILHVHISYR